MVKPNKIRTLETLASIALPKELDHPLILTLTGTETKPKQEMKKNANHES